MSLVAATFSALAMVLWRPPGRWLARHRLDLALPHLRVRASVMVVVVVAGLTIGPAMAAVSVPRAIVAVTIGAVAVFTTRQVQSERRRRRARERAAAASQALSLMAAELRAGILPQRVLRGLATDFVFLAPAARAADLGGDVPAALRATATEPGAGLLAELAGAWYVADRAGAPLAHVLDRLESSARDEHEVQREVQSGLAPARATGRLMGLLPLVGLGLGSGMGGDPVAVLVGSVPGALCLAVGAAFACAGVAWVEHIATGGEGD